MFEDLLEFFRELFRRRPKNEQIEEIIEEKEEEMRKYTNNDERFPGTIFEPVDVVIDGTTYTKYRASFRSLRNLYNYLISNPDINNKVFSTLHSVEKDSEFAGKDYDSAVEELVQPPRSEFKQILRLSEKIQENAMGYVKEFISVKSPNGGSIDIPAYCSGSPFCYRTRKSVLTPKFITLHISLGYYWGTSKKQVLNRAMIILALVNALEQNGYVVEINTFEVAREYDEIVEIDVNIKNNDETFDKSSLYKSLCYVEFLRRLLFRVLETLDVKNSWGSGYGETCKDEFVRAVRGCTENDIYFDQPRDMGIRGEDIVEDFDAAVSHLSLQDKIDIDETKEQFRKDMMTLRRTIK